MTGSYAAMSLQSRRQSRQMKSPVRADQWATPHYIMSGITSNVLYAQSDAKITFSGTGRCSQEKLIRIMEITTTREEEERIAALEKRVRDMDALVRGLVAEMLDLKTVAMALSRETGDRSSKSGQGPDVADPSASPSVPVSSDGSTIIRPKGVSRQDVLAGSAEPAMARIMQSDGTMKMEQRYGDSKTVDSSSASGRTRTGTSARSR